MFDIFNNEPNIVRSIIYLCLTPPDIFHTDNDYEEGVQELKDIYNLVRDSSIEAYQRNVKPK